MERPLEIADTSLGQHPQPVLLAGRLDDPRQHQVPQAPAYRTLTRRLGEYAKDAWRDRLAKVCAQRAAWGRACLVLYDVSTLWFEIEVSDGVGEPGLAKERRWDPQITVGLLTDAAGWR